MNALNVNSSHSPTKFSRPANLTTHTIFSLFSLHVEPAPHLLSACHTSSTIYIFLITSHQPLFQICITLPVELVPFFIPFRQPHSVHSPPGSPHSVHITSSQSSPSFSPSITPSAFYSRLKTHFFYKSFPP